MVRIFFKLVMFSNLICYWPLGDEDGSKTPWEAITFNWDCNACPDKDEYG